MSLVSKVLDDTAGLDLGRQMSLASWALVGNIDFSNIDSQYGELVADLRDSGWDDASEDLELTEEETQAVNTAVLVANDGAYTLEEFLNNLIEQARPAVGTVKAYLISLIDRLVLTIIVIIITSAFQPELVQVGKQTRSAMERMGILQTIGQQVQSTLTQEQLTKCRLARMDLKVRNEPTIEADVINELQVGAIVFVLKIHSNWALVEWTSEDDQRIVVGWVPRNLLAKPYGKIAN